MISNLPQPHKSDLKFLQRWLDRPGMGNCSFVGADRHIYDTNTSGLGTVTSNNGKVDPLTRFFLYSLPKLYHWAIVDPLYRLLGRWVKVFHQPPLQCYCIADFCRRQKDMCHTNMGTRLTLDQSLQPRTANHQSPKLRHLPPLHGRPTRHSYRILVQVNARLEKSLSILKVTSSSIATRISTTSQTLWEP